MFKSNSKKVLLAISVILSTSVYADSKGTEIDMKDPKAFSTVEVYKSDDAKANKIFTKYHKQYSDYVLRINKEMDGHSTAISKDITTEVVKTEGFIKEDQAKFDENCKKDLSAGEIAQCEALEKALFGMKEGVSSMNNDLKNELAGLENDRLNRLAKSYIDYKNRVGKLKVQVSNQ